MSAYGVNPYFRDRKGELPRAMPPGGAVNFRIFRPASGKSRVVTVAVEDHDCHNVRWLLTDVPMRAEIGLKGSLSLVGRGYVTISGEAAWIRRLPGDYPILIDRLEAE